MNRIALSLALLVAGAVLVGCDRPSQVFTGEVVATVNGEPITRAQLDLYSARRGGQVPEADMINDLISIELLRQAAEDANIHLRPDVASELATQRAAILAQAVVRERLESGEISDHDVQAEYDRYVADELGEELRARHILVPSREQADALIVALNDGADFAALAAEHSQDGSAQEGGDLGWFEPGMMVEPFAAAAGELEVGNYTTEPVQTQFGWHVIRLDDRRATDAPPLDQVRDEIRGYLQSQMVEAWVNELRENARIDIQFEHAN